jgi:hypothetical protein
MRRATVAVVGGALVAGLSIYAWKMAADSAGLFQGASSRGLSSPRAVTRARVAPVARAATASEPYVVPNDGAFYIARAPLFRIKATLAEDWVNPRAGEGVLNVFAPVAPELPSQADVVTRLYVAGDARMTAERVREAVHQRSMLRLRIASSDLSPRTGIALRIEYEATMLGRTLKRGAPPEPVPQLTPEERAQDLSDSSTMDFHDAGVVRWIDDHGLRRRSDEQVMQFGHRVFTYFVDSATYGGDLSGYEARRPSRVCRTFASDCGGLSLLFAAVMRASDVPARTLWGRWAVSQSDDYGQYHVIAEFFVPRSGWVPVDIAGTVTHKPADRNAFFGNTDGQHFAFHVDPDLEPAEQFRHAWAQYPLLQWVGGGDFWGNHEQRSRWTVLRSPIATAARTD